MAKQGRKAKRQAAREERERKAEAARTESAAASSTAPRTESQEIEPIDLPAPERAGTTSSTDLVLHGSARTLANVFIAVFLLYMLAMPARYYLTGGGHDERFSWRMFSTIRLQSCKARVHDVLGEREEPVKLDKLVQVAWIGMLERNRPLVVQRVLERRCAEEGVTHARYALSCTAPDGTKLPDVRKELDCKSGVLSEKAPSP